MNLSLSLDTSLLSFFICRLRFLLEYMSNMLLLIVSNLLSNFLCDLLLLLLHLILCSLGLLNLSLERLLHAFGHFLGVTLSIFEFLHHMVADV